MNIPEPGAHLDHMLRQTRMHHVQLSAMADVKANIMLTLASLVITFSIRYLTDPVLRWPVLTLIVFCLITILMAAYAVMPKRVNKIPLDVQHPQGNMLYFGNFANWTYGEFAEAMESVLLDVSRLYEVQVREIYELGVFLEQKKYRFIRYAYAAFISGLIAAGIVFVAAEIMRL